MARRLRRATIAHAAALLCAALILTGCSWGAEEPGLFGSTRPQDPSSTEPAPVVTPGPTNPSLPVAGDLLWTTGDGNASTIRFAVHAVRRTADATVLDWSVTPLAGPGRRAGQPVPEGTDLGLGRALAAEQDIVLLDPRTGRAYRPLANRSHGAFDRCLCTPLFAVTPSLHFGETRLLQLTFPQLDLGTFRVDVVFANTEVVPGVQVTQAAVSPVAERATDLTRPALYGNPATGEKTYVEPDAGRTRLSVVVNRVVATRGITSVVWTLHTVDAQGTGRFGTGPPVAHPKPAGVLVVTEQPADGAQLRVPGSDRPIGARWTTVSYAGTPAFECLCSSLGLWARSLRQAGGSAHLTTQVGALPTGTRRVDVLFPGLTPFTDVPVVWRADVAGAVETVEPGTDATWTYDEADPPLGWSTDQWPTPLPDPAQREDCVGDPVEVVAGLPNG